MPPREALHIGPFHIGSFTVDIPVYWYGIMIMLGVVTASFISYREARRRGEDPEHVWQMFPWVLIAGIVGARFGFVISKLNDPPVGGWNFNNIFAIWTGGLSIQGAVIFGMLAVIIYCNRSRISFFKWADIIVPGLALAQAIGRWGNFFNQEAFGRPTNLPWGIPISLQRQQEVAGQTFGPNVRFHPTFAYEMIWDLINFGLLIWLGRQKRIRLMEGDLTWIYIVIYSIGRFAIEAIRVDSSKVSGVPIPQIIAIISIVLAWSMFVIRHRPGSGARLSEANLPEGTRSGEPSIGRAAARSTRLRKVSASSVAPESDHTETVASTSTAVHEASTESR